MANENEKKDKPDTSAEQSIPQRPTLTEPVIDRVKGEYPAQPGKKNEKPCCDPPRVSKKAEWAHVFVSVILVVITAFILHVYSGQLEQMRQSTIAATRAADRAKESIDQIERNEHLDQRAWVTIKAVKIAKQPALDEIPEVTVWIINSGKTPALKVHFVSLIYIGRYADIARRDREPLGQPTEALIGPNSSVQSTSNMRFPIVDKSDLDSVTINETAWLYHLGIITYIDIFGTRHHTTFCYRWNGKQAPNETETRYFMWAGETGNTAD
jgi:hypothetical protein